MDWTDFPSTVSVLNTRWRNPDCGWRRRLSLSWGRQSGQPMLKRCVWTPRFLSLLSILISDGFVRIYVFGLVMFAGWIIDVDFIYCSFHIIFFFIFSVQLIIFFETLNSKFVAFSLEFLARYLKFVTHYFKFVSNMLKLVTRFLNFVIFNLKFLTPYVKFLTNFS